MFSPAPDPAAAVLRPSAQPRWRASLRRAASAVTAFLTLADAAGAADDHAAPHPHPHRRQLRAPARARRPRTPAPRAHHCLTPVHRPSRVLSGARTRVAR